MQIIPWPVASLGKENTGFSHYVWYVHYIKTLHTKFQVSSSPGTMRMTGTMEILYQPVASLRKENRGFLIQIMVCIYYQDPGHQISSL